MPSGTLSSPRFLFSLCFFFFNDPATTEIYTLSLHDALPIYGRGRAGRPRPRQPPHAGAPRAAAAEDRKSTRLNSSHSQISYAVFCLKKKKKPDDTLPSQHIHQRDLHD